MTDPHCNPNGHGRHVSSLSPTSPPAPARSVPAGFPLLHSDHGEKGEGDEVSLRDVRVSLKTITCFCPSGQAQAVLDRLRKEKGIVSASAHHARGAGLATRNTKGRLFFLEKEIITALVPADRADEIFEFLYFAAGIDERHAGMVLMGGIVCGDLMTLPDLPDEQ